MFFFSQGPKLVRILSWSIWHQNNASIYTFLHRPMTSHLRRKTLWPISCFSPGTAQLIPQNLTKKYYQPGQCYSYGYWNPLPVSWPPRNFFPSWLTASPRRLAGLLWSLSLYVRILCICIPMYMYIHQDRWCATSRLDVRVCMHACAAIAACLCWLRFGFWFWVILGWPNLKSFIISVRASRKKNAYEKVVIYFRIHTKIMDHFFHTEVEEIEEKRKEGKKHESYTY